MRKIVLISLFFSLLHSLDIDIEAFKQEAVNDPANINARLVLARTYIKNGNLDEAKIALRQVLAIEKNHQKAKLLMNKIKDKSIEQRYIKTLKEKNSVGSALNLYNLYIKKGRKEDAKKLKIRYKKKSINNPIYQALQKKEQEILLVRSDRLETIYKKSKSFEDFKKYYYELEGLGYKKLGFKKLERFVDENKLNEHAVLFLANQYYWTKKSTKSLKVLKPVIKHTKNSEILALYAKLVPKKTYKKKLNSKYRAEKYFLKKQYLKSIPYYRAYFKKVSNDSNTRFHYATALENLKQYEKAEKQYLLVSKQRDKLYELSTYRYARVMIEQRNETKWDKARNILTNLLETIANKPPTKERNDILKYTQQNLAIVSQPMPKATMHKDIMLTAEQSKILNQQTFSANIIKNQNVFSIKTMLNPKLSSIKSSEDIEATLFGSILDDENMKNNYFGLLVGNSNLSLKVKKSTFKNSDSNRSKKLDSSTIRAFYNNGDNFSMSIGMHSFEDATDIVGKLEYQKTVNNHNITYGLEYQNGIFINGATCMEENDINTISLSIYDLILMKNLENTELMITINSFSDGNINVNSWTDYPIYRTITNSFENSFSLVGSYEYNSKKDTCYGAAEFFDNSQLEIKSKYQFASGGFIEAMGSTGYSFKNGEVLYSYGVVLQLITTNALDVYVDCKHYQSGYSPNGANVCYASILHVW
jgi:hypothetical protein